MIRTETELRQLYAARAGSAVSERELQAWLDGGVCRPHRNLLPALAAAAVIAVALAGAWFGGVFDSRRTPPLAGQSSPPDVPAAQGVQGVFWDPAHPDTLQVVAMIGYPGHGSPCLASRTVSVAAQTASSVTIDVAPSVSVSASALPALCSPVYVAPIAVQLDAALNGRAVTDSLSGRSVTVVDVSDVPEPATVPAGYVTKPLALTLGLIGPTGVVDNGSVEMTRHPRIDAMQVGAERDYRNGDKVLDIRTGAPDPAYDPALLGGDTHPPFEVDGHPAHVDIAPGTDDTICVSWQSAADRANEVCSSDDPIGDTPLRKAPLTVGQVIDVAQHLH